MDRSKMLKTIGIILGAILAIWLVLFIIKKNTEWGKSNLTWLPLGGGEQEFFRYHADIVSTNPQAGSEQYRYRQEIPDAPAFPEMQAVPMRPSLIAPIPPRFDANQLSSNLTAQSAAPLDLMAAPPSASPLDAMTFDNVDFQNLGGQGAPLPTGGLSSQQVSDMLRDKVGSGKPELQNTKDLMPVPDMRYTTGLDPTDPQNFMYDRTIFGRLKRRYGNDVDFFRGDLDIKPQYRGWFDLQPPTETDVVVGYFDRYIDIEQETAIRDSSFTRATPLESLYKGSVNPMGKTDLTRYDHV
jgi:hypothetical protein